MFESRCLFRPPRYAQCHFEVKSCLLVALHAPPVSTAVVRRQIVGLFPLSSIVEAVQGANNLVVSERFPFLVDH